MNADIVILSAGSSQRLGCAKQHIVLSAQPLLLRACDLAHEFTRQQNAQRPPLVVVGPFADRDRRALAACGSCDIVENRRWQEGLPASLACAIESRRDSDAVLVLLVDQYQVQIEDLLRLHALWRRQPSNPAAATYAGTVGPPVIWPSHYFARLAERKTPAKTLLQAVPHQRIDMPRAVADLDVPDDLARLREFEGEKNN